MLSIIICSRAKSISITLSENLKDTIGCDYELIVIDNSENKYSIFEAYNLGIDHSKGDYLCFLHDDIIFHTDGWGNIVHRIFNDNLQIGLIGVAGAKVKTKMPSGWWDCPDKYKEINIIQHLENHKVEKWKYGFTDGNISEVVAIDGVFMVMRKNEDIRFDTKMKGFHGYDLNISMEYKIRGYKIVVTNSILVEHLSNGNVNESWYESTMRIHKNFSKNLPLIVEDKNFENKIKSLEIKNGFNFLKHCLAFGFQKGIFKLWLKIFYLQPFSKIHFVIIKICIKRILIIKNYTKNKND